MICTYMWQANCIIRPFTNGAVSYKNIPFYKLPKADFMTSSFSNMLFYNMNALVARLQIAINL